MKSKVELMLPCKRRVRMKKIEWFLILKKKKKRLKNREGWVHEISEFMLSERKSLLKSYLRY